MIVKVLLIVLILIISYELANKLVSKNILSKFQKYFIEKNDKYYEDLILVREKEKGINFTKKKNIFQKIAFLLDSAGIKNNILINPITVFIICLACFFLIYLVTYKFFKNMILSLIIAGPTISLPIILLKFITEQRNQRIEGSLLNFLLQLKNSTKINNDVIYALKEVQTIEPLQSYIDKAVVQINSGVKFEKAIETFKEKIQIKRFNMMLTNLQYCYLHGGNFSDLLSKNYEIISRIQKEKNSRVQETRSARLVLLVLIILDLFVYFNFIQNDYENYLIMQKGIVGNIILYWNFISMWFLLLLSYNVKKLNY